MVEQSEEFFVKNVTYIYYIIYKENLFSGGLGWFFCIRMPFVFVKNP